MIDKGLYALKKWKNCRVWGCHNIPTDNQSSMAKCIVCNRNKKVKEKSMFEKYKGY